MIIFNLATGAAPLTFETMKLLKTWLQKAYPEHVIVNNTVWSNIFSANRQINPIGTIKEYE